MPDVLIVGGGPAGLFLAAELRLAGVEPLVLERLASPDTGDKAHGLAGQVVRLLDQRGLFERCGGKGAPKPAPGFFFAGFPLPLHRLGDDNPLYLLPIDQADLERVLLDRAVELGVEVRRGWSLQTFTESDESVAASVVDPDGREHRIDVQYLIGCDGARSVVRKQAGIGFPGDRDQGIVDRWAMVAATDAVQLKPGGRAQVAGLGEIQAHFHRSGTGVFTILGRDPARPILNTAEWQDDVPAPDVPMTLDEMADSVERVLGVRVPLAPPPAGAPELLRRLRGRNARLADQYRAGRVFVAGDAAHTSHGPTLNLALQDGANLAWKLAAAIQGWAPPALLDSYFAERHATGARELMWTQAETALLAPGPDVTALRVLFGEALQREDELAAIAAVMAGADTRYDMGDMPAEGPTGWFVRPAEVLLEDGSRRRLAELMHDARPLLLDLTRDRSLAEDVAPWSRRVRHIAAARPDDASAASLLVRPDGYVAWSGRDRAGLQEALQAWFGQPDTEAA